MLCFGRGLLRACGLGVTLALMPLTPTFAAPYAAIVMDGRTGEVIYADNANTRLHPASLTKMMTLYITFQEIEAGHISLDTKFTVSKAAASQAPSRLGLKTGQQIAVRYLIRAAAIKSANDAAYALAEGIGGNRDAFAARMNATAKQLGMKNTTFKNPNGLTAAGHMSTAYDMTVLGRHLFYDFPQYYQIFSRRTDDAGLARVQNTNRHFLDAYKGADGIKTGYTAPAGFNLTASAERNGVRLMATIMGGKSTADRNARMAQLLDMGFAKAKRGVKTTAPDPALIASADPEMPEATAADPSAVASAVDDMQDDIDAALAEAAAPKAATAAAAEPAAPKNTQPLAFASNAPPKRPKFDPVDAAVSQAMALTDAGADTTATDVPAAVQGLPREDALAAAVAAATNAPNDAQINTTGGTTDTTELASAAPTGPARKSAPNYDAAPTLTSTTPETEVVTTLSTSGGRDWAIKVGRYTTRFDAERALLKTQLAESATLAQSRRVVSPRGGAFDAMFAGLSQSDAALACRRMAARGADCTEISPGS